MAALAVMRTCFDCGGTPDQCECPEFVECTCVRVDVDQDDARDCLAHGPRSSLVREMLEREAEAEAAYWRGWKF